MIIGPATPVIAGTILGAFAIVANAVVPPLLWRALLATLLRRTSFLEARFLHVVAAFGVIIVAVEFVTCLRALFGTVVAA
jgi:hypothetical protein